jgi:putative ABC transport system permease protein
MISSIFHIIYRNISRQIGFTLINVIGLAVGLAASLLIMMWVIDELGYDHFNKNGDSIFMVAQDQYYTSDRYRVRATPFPSGPEWKARIPEIKRMTRWVDQPTILIRQGERVFYEKEICAADSMVFDLFTFPLSMGDVRTVLRNPHSIVISGKLARKYFGDENPVGKTLLLENKTPFIVTAVMFDIPENSSVRAEAIIPYSYLEETGMTSTEWGNNAIITFIQLEKGADLKDVGKKLTSTVVEHNPHTKAKFFPFPLLKYHLHSHWGFGEGKGGILNVIIFITIAVFVLLIACINFINLATAKSETRGKEIGIKKVAGANRISMIFQFMTESMTVVMIALVVALVLVALSLGVFNTISGKHFTLADIFQLKFIAGFILVGLATGFIAGIYPSFYLSSLKPVLVLKGETISGRKNGMLRKILVVVQFSLSVFIALGAIFMYLQLRFMQEKELGFDKENLVSIPMSNNIKKKYYSLKKELQKEPLIAGVTAATWNPTAIYSNSGGADWDGKDPKQDVLIGDNAVDYDYLKTLKMKLVAGRDFSPDFHGDKATDSTGNYLVNEEVAKLMGGGNVVGKRFNFGGSGQIIGVMKNFHFESASLPIMPIAFYLSDTSSFNVILVRLAAGNLPASLKALETTWHRVIPDYPLEYTFTDKDYDKLYKRESRMALLLKYFTIVALVIACLGLYGLSAYSASRRTREIGVRKVMGAGMLSVMYSMSREFLILVFISITIAFPFGWYVINKMLRQFAYRIDVSWVVFGAIGLGAIVIAMVTISFQAFRAAGVNPSVALKAE